VVLLLALKMKEPPAKGCKGPPEARKGKEVESLSTYRRTIALITTSL
jgi:hypothetical protein